MASPLKIHGSLLLAILDAGKHLDLIFRRASPRIGDFGANQYYPMEVFRGLLDKLGQYDDPRFILEQMGMEMMRGWYDHGPGKNIVSSGLDFLQYQTGSGGFRSVVEGPEELAGAFELSEFNPSSGTATITSTTVFPRDLERGILLGGLGLTGDLLYFDVSNEPEVDRFAVVFVTIHNKRSLSWSKDGAMSDLEWEFAHYKNQTARKEEFWHSINRTLNKSYTEMQEALAKAKLLSGMLPICAACKKIRDDKGYWNQIEEYLSEHSEAEFSHGICPECARRLYPGYHRDD
jgi:hypothetical protein